MKMDERQIERMRELLSDGAQFLADCCQTTMSCEQPIAPMSPDIEKMTVGEWIDEATALLDATK